MALVKSGTPLWTRLEANKSRNRVEIESKSMNLEGFLGSPYFEAHSLRLKSNVEPITN